MDKYIHIKSGEKYHVLKVVTNKSIPIDSKMILSCKESNYSNLYVRDLNDFNQKFKLLSSDEINKYQKIKLQNKKRSKTTNGF